MTSVSGIITEGATFFDPIRPLLAEAAQIRNILQRTKDKYHTELLQIHFSSSEEVDQRRDMLAQIRELARGKLHI